MDIWNARKVAELALTSPAIVAATVTTKGSVIVKEKYSGTVRTVVVRKWETLLRTSKTEKRKAPGGCKRYMSKTANALPPGKAYKHRTVTHTPLFNAEGYVTWQQWLFGLPGLCLG